MLISDMHTSAERFSLATLLSCALALPLTFIGCSRSSATAAQPSATLAAQQQQAMESARQQLELIPPPSKTRYMAVRSLTSWENPYLTVQGGMVTLHVLIADANPSPMGQGGLLRPVGARRRNLDVRVSDLPTALNAIPESAWPYGRVVAVEEAHEVPVSARAEVRRNVETVLKMLGDLGVVTYEWNDSSRGL
ncbi:hypothetical protein [Edaphobacter flagellatus]|uniref:hypothetical protein n=1 Tax=Edaphobacter flagellatus TaxID=1933044 RepID=UPI0021B4C2E5|nr:hypothetical protein [Edaphobacter flagellatus]